MTTPNQIAPEFNFNTHLLTTNTIPSQHDRSLIHHTLSSIDRDIFQAELDIAQLQKPLEKRTADHAALMKHRASLAAVVSPLRQLPLEIFGHFFLYATLDDPRFPLCFACLPALASSIHRKPRYLDQYTDWELLLEGICRTIRPTVTIPFNVLEMQRGFAH